MPEIIPASKPNNGENISRGLKQPFYPRELRVRLESNHCRILIELDAPGGAGLFLSLQGASVLARELRKTVRGYLNPKPAAESDSQETG